MLKKIDKYVFKQFIGPFLIIFAVLFFLFLIALIFQQLNIFLGRGLDILLLGKLIFYLGIGLFRLVIPLSILLASIMIVGGLGERYELAAIKSTGTSLWRALQSLFLFSILMTFLSFYINDNISTNFKRRADNIVDYIKSSEIDAIIQPGIFLNDPDNKIPAIRAEQKIGDSLYNVYIVDQKAPALDRRIIFAKKGIFINDKKLPIATLKLFNGHIYQDKIEGITDINKQKKQPTEKIKFTQFITRFDLKDIFNKGSLNEDKEGSTYSSLDFIGLKKQADSLKKGDSLSNINFNKFSFAEITNVTNEKPEKTSPIDQKKFLYQDTVLNLNHRIQTLDIAKSKISAYKNNHFTNREETILENQKKIRRYNYEIYGRFIYAIECLVMFLIGSSLGSIIRKGGFGIPMIMGIVIFISFMLLESFGKNLTTKFFYHPLIGAGLPVLILFPLGIYLMIKANNDSEIFNLDKIINPFRKLYRKIRPEKLHKRYQ